MVFEFGILHFELCILNFAFRTLHLQLATDHRLLSMIDALQNIANLQSNPAQRPNDEALRKAAMQFEAILLQQLTSALSSSGDDEDSLFGGDGGTGLAKQLFAEQLATTMAQSGGVGLADLMLRQFGVAPANSPVKSFNAAASAIKMIKQAPSTEPVPTTRNSATPNRSGRIEPVVANPSNSSDVEIISTFEDEIVRDGIDESLLPLLNNGVIHNSTRPRIVPNAPVQELRPQSPVAPISSDPSVNSPAIVSETRFQMPVKGRISSDFGTRFHPIDKRAKFHGGIDIAVPTGTKVAASADGIVKFAGWKGGYGNTVVISHPDGSETLYGHNSKLLVAEGQKVNRGDPISLSGSTGKSTGPHLHFELRRNGKLVNPTEFLSNVLPARAER